MKSIKNKQFKDKKKDLSQKLNMFDKIGDCCLICNEPFDKRDKEQVQSWFVVVRQKQNQVRLYCPTCWQRSKKILENIVENLKEKEVDKDI